MYIAPFLTEGFGRKKALLGTLVYARAVILTTFVARYVQVIFTDSLLTAFPWGVFTTRAPTYASEVTPHILRSYLETYVILC